MPDRRSLGAALLGLISGAALPGRDRTKPSPPLRTRPAFGPDRVPTGASRADGPWLDAADLFRAERYAPDGPPVDMLYQVVDGEPASDPTRIALADGRWARQIFPSGILDARAFGAVGDGRADDTAALQAFLDAVVTGGTRGYIPAGTYRTTMPLRVGGLGRGATYRGFTIEGAGRAGLSGRAGGGTLILIDAPTLAEAVLLWAPDAWRDARLSGLGLASVRLDGARYGLLIQSSEVSHLAFEHLHVENVTTAFGLLRGTGANGEFCGWSNVQTWRVRNYFYSDAGQAYGLRFSDSFCNYRAGGTLFRFATQIVGGGMRLINFDASPTLIDRPLQPAERSNTTLFALSGLHNSPVTVIGGRFEHLTTIADIDTDSADIVRHNQLQFIGCDFTTDLDNAAVDAKQATVRLRSTALADLRFSGCSFASALFKRTDLRIVVASDRGCRGTVQFDQCGFWGYSRLPNATGGQPGRLSVAWTDCTANTAGAGGDWRAQTMGGPFNHRVGDLAPTLPSGGNLLLQSGVIDGPAATRAAAPWRHRGAPAFRESALALEDGAGAALVLAAGAGLHQDIVAPGTDMHYHAQVRLAPGRGVLRLSITDAATGRILDEAVIAAPDEPVASLIVALQARADNVPGGRYRIAIDNDGAGDLSFEIKGQQASEHPDAAFAAAPTRPEAPRWT